MDIPDHPEIARALRTGYPRPLPPHVTCRDCDKELYGDDPVYLVDGAIVCEGCLEERIDEMMIADLAERLGMERTTAGEYLEGLHER